MAQVNICNVDVKDNPCPFKHPFQFEITFECIDNLSEGDSPSQFKARFLIYIELE